eukprot:m.131457 g.131457  ORF g.131457 m.131457 type:complete len:89 (-) comp9471_c0_seq3:160-426(-)
MSWNSLTTELRIGLAHASALVTTSLIEEARRHKKQQLATELNAFAMEAGVPPTALPPQAPSAALPGQQPPQSQAAATVPPADTSAPMQ